MDIQTKMSIGSLIEPRCSQMGEKEDRFLEAFLKNRSFYKETAFNFLFKPFISNKQIHICEAAISSKAPCGHWIWHPDCGRCGVIVCPMKCRCMD